MVLLTIVTKSNPHTLYFDQVIEKPSYIRLLSASLCNSWYNLKKGGAVSSLPDGNGSSSVIPLAAGHYTVDLSAEEFNNMKNIKPNLKLMAKTNTQLGLLVINNPDNLRFKRVPN